MTNIQSRDEWLTGKCRDPMEDREGLINSQVRQMLRCTTRMIKINNLPDTIPERDANLLIQVNGYAVGAEVPDKGVYLFYAGLGGEPNPYYLPTIATIANPALRYNATLRIGDECVVIRNDSLYQGIMPILTKYATMIVDAEISLRYAVLNARVPKVLQADNDTAYNSAKQFFEDIKQGKPYGITMTEVFGQDLVDGLTAIDYSSNPPITAIIEALQYCKGSCWNDLGLKAAFNMKREAINEAEAALNDNILYPLVDDMLEQQSLGWKEFNKMFGYNVSVEFDSVWDQNRKEDELKIDKQEADISLVEAQAETTEESEESTDDSIRESDRGRQSDSKDD